MLVCLFVCLFACSLLCLLLQHSGLLPLVALLSTEADLPFRLATLFWGNCFNRHSGCEIWRVPELAGVAKGSLGKNFRGTRVELSLLQAIYAMFKKSMHRYGYLYGKLRKSRESGMAGAAWMFGQLRKSRPTKEITRIRNGWSCLDFQPTKEIARIRNGWSCLDVRPS